MRDKVEKRDKPGMFHYECNLIHDFPVGARDRIYKGAEGAVSGGGSLTNLRTVPELPNV